MGKIAIIGGSGVTDSPGFKDAEWKKINTDYDNGFGGKGIVFYMERADGVIFIPRHGKHTSEAEIFDYPNKFGPSKTQYGANLLAALALGADRIMGTTAVGSLNDLWNVGKVVILEDYIDETGRQSNLYGKGIVVHTNPRPAFSESVRDKLIESVKENPNLEYCIGGTCVIIPGDRFGTKAEGIKRRLYADLVGMTLCPEASMAMELGIHYASMAFIVDMDDDANHEGSTLEVMKDLSQPQKVPFTLETAIKKLSSLPEELPLLPQLKGNIIPDNTYFIENKILSERAKYLVENYCN